MPIIMVSMLRGRNAAQKRELIRELTQGTVRALGVPEQAVRIVLTEIDPDHWGAGGVTMAMRDEEAAR